jgi:hypothetical protein
MTTVHALDSARQPYTLELAAHHFHVVALRSTDHMQQTCFAEPADPYAHRVVTAVQGPHRRLQRFTVLRGG